MSARTVDVGDGHIVTHLDEPAPCHPERAACDMVTHTLVTTTPATATTDCECGHVKLRGLHTHIYQCSVYEASHGGEVGKRIGYERNIADYSVCDCHPNAEVTA